MAKNKKRRLEHRDNRAVGKTSQTQSDTVVKTSTKKQDPSPTIPFDLEDRILLVGEGDFSFARSIVEHHGCCDINATCLDSREELDRKYQPQAEENIAYLEGEGQSVIYHVDATRLEKNKALRIGEKFACIMFNFPHVGGKSTDMLRQVRYNQELIFKFLTSAAGLLRPSGSIVVTLFEGEPYTLWNIKNLARSASLAVDRSFAFQADAYPGYRHARTLGNIDGGGGWKGELRKARSYTFKLKNDSSDLESTQQPKKRKKTHDAESDSD